MRLAEALLDSVARVELEPLARAFRESMERTNRTLDATLDRLEHLKEAIERDRIEVREAVRRSGEEWPFPLPSRPRAQ